MKSHVAGIQSSSGSVVTKAIGVCPEIMLSIGGHKVRCLIVNVNSLFFREHFGSDQDLIEVSPLICIIGSYGLHIPYLGYIELQLTVAEDKFPCMGFLTVRDLVDSIMGVRKYPGSWCVGF